MAITIRSITAGSNDGTTATVSATTPTGATQAQVGDVLLIFHGNDFYTTAAMPTPTVSPGSPTVTAVTNGTADGGTNLGHIKSYTAVVATGGAQTVSVTETGTHDEEKSLYVLVLAGADTTTPVDIAANTSGGSATSQPAPSVSPTSSDALLVCVSHSGGGSATASYTAPGSMSNKTEIHVGGLSAVLATEQLVASGATGTRTFTAANAIPWAAVSVAVKTAAAATATFPPQRQKRQPIVPLRAPRGRQQTPVRAQLNPPYPFAEIVQPRRIRGLLARRGRQQTPVRAQVNPPFPTAEIVHVRRLRGWLLRRGHQVAPPVPMQGAPVDPVDQPRRIRGLLPRRGRQATPVRAQVNPPFPFAEVTQPRRIRGLLARRGRSATPVPGQVTFVNPAFPWSAIVQPKRLRGLLPRRGRIVQPVQAQAAPVAPAWIPDRIREKVRLWPSRRGRTSAVPATQERVLATPQRRRHLALRVRGRAAQAPVEQFRAPQATPRRRLAGLRLRHVASLLPLKQATAPPAPSFVPSALRHRLQWLIPRRARLAWPVFACDCITHRPSTGTVGRPNTGTVAHDLTMTSRPDTGTVTRPDTGIVKDPCC